MTQVTQDTMLRSGDAPAEPSVGAFDRGQGDPPGMPDAGVPAPIPPPRAGRLYWAAIIVTILALLVTGVLASDSPAQQTLGLSLLAAGATLVAMQILRMFWARWSRSRSDRGAALDGLLQMQPGAMCVTDPNLTIRHANSAARHLLQVTPGTRLDTAPPLSAKVSAEIARMVDNLRHVADTDPLQVTLGADGWTLSARALSDDATLWRLDPVIVPADGPADTPGHAAQALPTLGFDPRGTVQFSNAQAQALLGGTPADARSIFGHAAPPAAGQIVQITTAEGRANVLLADLPGPSSNRQVALIPCDAQPNGNPSENTDWGAFEDLPVALMWISAQGRIRRANRGAMRLIGEACVPGVALSDLTEGLGRPLTDWLDEAISGFRSNAPEFLRVTGTAQETFVQMSLHPMADPMGNRRNAQDDTALLAVVSDATELKTLEAQFVQSQKMQAIGQLAGGVAHDFNNLLTAISGHCDLLLLRHDQGDPEYADLMQINQNSNRAAALVNQLLAFSRKQTLRPEEIDLRDTLADLTHLLNRLVGEKITLSFSHDSVLGAIRADKRQLEQVLMNLVVNARDAIDGAGEIRIVTERITYDSVQTRDNAQVPPGEYVSVKVIDTGCGIPPDRLSKVFEPFYTTKKVGEGTGLGLSTVYGIIKQTGGFIFADSTLGDGACFTLLFRATKSDPALRAQAVQDPAHSARHADGVVLLVEDEAPVRSFASRALRLRGYTVLEAESGEDALTLLENADLHIDIFVTDVVMPGMDGPTWVRQALEARPDVRVIFVSGYAEEHFGDEQARIPNSVFLPKPFSLAELTQTVQGS